MAEQILVMQTRKKRSTEGDAIKSGHPDPGCPPDPLSLGRHCPAMTTVTAIRVTPGDSSV